MHNHVSRVVNYCTNTCTLCIEKCPDGKKQSHRRGISVISCAVYPDPTVFIHHSLSPPLNSSSHTQQDSIFIAAFEIEGRIFVLFFRSTNQPSKFCSKRNGGWKWGSCRR
ncbi:hypothetical protein L1987_34733 [Smallanthus sonchifolius]|uniref:Uncharacterized protein n=1 Tax=Smallanthus sonchifolius TaxID=185202 RepID=A0ACB9HW35_9ASTR|nr:hypothetical protein L1987_34733 [Smallanthus sonchifolius]